MFERRKDYPTDIKKEIELYAVDKQSHDVAVIGSFSYKMPYSSDVDLFENIKRESVVQTINYFARSIKKIVNNLILMPEQYFCEVKMGIDHLFAKIDYGICANDKYIVSDAFFDEMRIFYKKNFIDEGEFDIIEQIEKKINRDQLDYEMVFSIMRDHFILRWNSNEIERNYKVLVSYEGVQYKYTIEEALMDVSKVNIEGIFINSLNRYVEISNFFVLIKKGAKGDEIVINLPQDYLSKKDDFFRETLNQSIYTLIHSKLRKYYSPFKAIKRMYSYARYFKMKSLLNFARMVISSQYGKLYNLHAQLKTLEKLLSVHGYKPLNMQTMRSQIDYIIWNLQEITFADFDANMCVTTLKTLGNMTFGEKGPILSEIINYIGDYVNGKALIILKNNKLYPLPKFLQPINKPF